MNPAPARCLVLACGNPLREDDGVGPWLAQWAQQHFSTQPGLRILSRQQWTPELAQDLALARTALFLDCSASTQPGQISLVPVHPASAAEGLATHHLDPAQLLHFARSLYGAAPARALLFTIGAASLQLREGFSPNVQAALPRASALLADTLRRLLVESDSAPRA